MKNIKDHENLKQKKVLLRLDLNVPIKNGLITDDTRINKILPIIEFLLKKDAKIIIISHVGRPKGKINKDLSLKPICTNLEKKINKKIRLVNDDIFKLKKENLFKDFNDEIIFLENLRFYKEEEENDVSFAKHLAGLADLFINDAFSCSHREHASISRITEFLPPLFLAKKLINSIEKYLTRYTVNISAWKGFSKKICPLVLEKS